MNYTYAEYFAGIGAPGKAIKRTTERHGDTCEFVYGFEIDKYARNAFAAIHEVSEDKIYTDITNQPETLPYVDIVFYSPPCQTFSIAGKREGSTVDKGNLFYNALEGIKKSKPKFAIMENVKNLANEFRKDLDNMLFALEDAGYFNYAKVLNSKDYGIPQNRERIFIVSVRKDIYEQGKRFKFPNPIKLDKRLKDVLQKEVDEKYYLSDKMINSFINNKVSFQGRFQPKNKNDIANTLTARYFKMGRTDNYIKVEQVASLNRQKESNFSNPQRDRIYSVEGLSPTLATVTGGGLEPKILVNSATKKGYEVATEGDSINLDQPTSKTRRGRVGKQVAQTLTTSCNQAVVEYPCIAASRGRDKENPSDRAVGNKNLQQRLEVNSKGISNALTNVQKDNYVIERNDINGSTQKRDTIKILQILWKEIGKESFTKWGLGILDSFQKENLLQQKLHEESIYKDRNEQPINKECKRICAKDKRTNFKKEIMRKMQLEKKSGCAPQRQESTKQFVEQFRSCLQELPQQDSQGWKDLQNMWSETQSTWVLQQALYKIQEVRESANMPWEKDFRIRKLTPKECFRLMGFDDSDYYKAVMAYNRTWKAGASDSQMYKRAGNSITVQVEEEILENLLYDRQQPGQLMLF